MNGRTCPISILRTPARVGNCISSTFRKSWNERMRGEISFDLVMENEMEFVEGTFRLPGEPWRVFVVSRGEVNEPEVLPQVWNSGAAGFFVRFPQNEALNRTTVESILSWATGVTEWEVVPGPDSMNLR